MKKAKVVNCHELSVRRDVTIPEEYDEVVSVYKEGDTIYVDDSLVFWSWNDIQYYKTQNGYVAVKGVEIIT